MTDFPVQNVLPLHIHTWTQYLVAHSAKPISANLGTPTSQSWPTANRALYLPMYLPFPYPVQRVFWGNGSALANMDLGIYTPRGVKLASTGSVAQSGASAIQYANLSILLSPGRYYLALANSGTTNVVMGTTVAAMVSQMRLAGAVEQAAAFALPATATFAQFSAIIYPLCGLTRTASGF